jgi:hypothetical protein
MIRTARRTPAVPGVTAAGVALAGVGLAAVPTVGCFLRGYVLSSQSERAFLRGTDPGSARYCYSPGGMTAPAQPPDR